LRKKTSINDVRRQVTAVTGLSVIAPGLHLDSEIDDLEGAGIADVIASVAERSRVVIVRAPATSVGADAQLLARLSDAAIPVVAVGGTHRDSIEETLRQWAIMGTEVPGVVAVPQYGPGPDAVLVSPKKSERTGERLSRAAATR
jgi:Mrp family chromosome partitioning ATPase